jgi:hypothetical protein
VPPGKSQPVRQDEEKVVERIGNLTFAGYTLDAPFEMVPGTWTFQLWVGDRMMAEKSALPPAMIPVRESQSGRFSQPVG